MSDRGALRLVSDEFLAQAVIAWQVAHGRHDLPWQNTRDPYRVWLSEIMLQQTQVGTVLAYFERFLSRFPDVAALANASLDDVLGLWSGLGYYSRARNMHRCAQEVMHQHAGVFPQSAQQLQHLPGIGPSTAAAIASLCFSERVAILDGNVKRVLTRYLGFSQDLSVVVNERRLWQLAHALLPRTDLVDAMPRYTQGMMDLGATLCTARKPACESCPLQNQCVAHRQFTPLDFPVKTRRIKRSAQSIWMLWARTQDGALWLNKRPTPGVWAGLYCFALFDSHQEMLASVPDVYRVRLLGLPVVKHVLTHKDLHLHPFQLELPYDRPPNVSGAWFESSQWERLGMPAPVRKLLHWV
ncbi:MAG: A/G-specific adenine glycosylase [Comamonadaceae bacterium]|nr:MAG: A/G-specific adenine glycosylase [Comamonadaceae bacterium]